ncbi:MAG: ABC transporter ATP-binding protein [Ignavibacteriales bacterium]|nr:ABC transporter ATP-binding protein [Ignavibacteriales bacterium]
MVENLVEIFNLTKRFDDKVILDDISINVEKGENLIVFGRSGSGKSVLLKCIIGLITPDKGEISIMGKNVHNLKIKKLNNLRKNISFLFQSAALYDSMTVRENLEFPLIRNFNISHNVINEKIIKTLELVGLEDAIYKMPSELSGGMRKRIGLARSIITDPKLILYDEPTTGLDPITSKEISELILNLQKQLNMTSIVVTHDLICAEIIADRVIFLRDGKIAYQGALEELKTIQDPFLQNFFSNKLLNE